LLAGYADIADGYGRLETDALHRQTEPVHGCTRRDVEVRPVTAPRAVGCRNAEWMRAIYEFCGLRVAHIQGDMEPDERRDAYAAEVTDCASREIVADVGSRRIGTGWN